MLFFHEKYAARGDPGGDRTVRVGVGRGLRIWKPVWNRKVPNSRYIPVIEFMLEPVFFLVGNGILIVGKRRPQGPKRRPQDPKKGPKEGN